MEIDREKFKKMFPHLAKEMERGESEISITSIRSDIEMEEKAASKGFDDYDPDIVDFLRRCDNEKQAEEIIEYLEGRGEISQEYACQLRKKLKKKGVRTFGRKKEDGFYLKQAGF